MKNKSIKDASPTQLKDKDFISESLAHDSFSRDVSNLQYASKKLRDDKEFIVELIKSFGGHVLEYASERLKNDIALIKFSFNYGGHFSYLSPELKENKELILAYLKVYNKQYSKQSDGRMKPIIQSLSIENFLDQNIFEIVVKRFANFLQLLSFDHELYKDKEFAKKALQINGYSLKYFSRNIKDDIELVSIACKDRSYPIQFASSRIKRLIKEYDNHNEFFDKYLLQENLNKNLNVSQTNQKKIKI